MRALVGLRLTPAALTHCPDERSDHPLQAATFCFRYPQLALVTGSAVDDGPDKIELLRTIQVLGDRLQCDQQEEDVIGDQTLVAGRIRDDNGVHSAPGRAPF